MGRLADSAALLEPLLKRQEVLFGEGHADTIVTRNSLATTYQTIGTGAESHPPARGQSPAGAGQVQAGPPSGRRVRANLAAAYHRAGRTKEAIPLMEAVLKQNELKLGPVHESVITSA